MISAPTLPHKKNLNLQKLSNENQNPVVNTKDGTRSKNAASNPSNPNSFTSDCTDDLPPPPLPRKPQIQDPLGAANNVQNKNSYPSSPIKYQSMNTKEFDASRNVVVASSGDSSPPSSLSAESTNSEETKSFNSKTKYLGAIPKRKSSTQTNTQSNGLHGMAKHMTRNKNSR